MGKEEDADEDTDQVADDDTNEDIDKDADEDANEDASAGVEAYATVGTVPEIDAWVNALVDDPFLEAVVTAKADKLEEDVDKEEEEEMEGEK